MLTDEEHALLAALGQCYNAFSEICGNEVVNDRAEFAAKIHDLQYAVMANAAARQHPDLYRLRGHHGAWQKIGEP
jgi:hypothetical protein